MTLMLRKAREGDLEELIDVVNRAYDVETGNTGVSFKCAPRFCEEEDAQKQLKHFYVLEENGKIVGGVKTMIKPPKTTMKEKANVVNIGPVAVDPDHQGKGYGAKLLDFAESLAATAEIDCVSCRSDLFPLYAKRGYKEVCRVPAETYIPVEAMTRTGLEMVVMHKQSPTPNVLKNMTLLLRKAKEGDLKELIDVINRAYDVETGNTGVSFKCARRSENLPDPQNQLKYFHVLEENGKIVGVVKTRMKENADVVIIGPVAVDPDHQGKGYGAKLLDFAESLAATAEIDCVSCRTDLFPFYAKRGYQEVWRVPAETIIPVEVMTRTGLEMVIMHKHK